MPYEHGRARRIGQVWSVSLRPGLISLIQQRAEGHVVQGSVGDKIESPGPGGDIGDPDQVCVKPLPYRRAQKPVRIVPAWGSRSERVRIEGTFVDGQTVLRDQKQNRPCRGQQMLAQGVVSRDRPQQGHVPIQHPSGKVAEQGSIRGQAGLDFFHRGHG